MILMAKPNKTKHRLIFKIKTSNIQQIKIVKNQNFYKRSKNGKTKRLYR